MELAEATLRGAKERIERDVTARADVLVDASHEIHAHPELNYEERFAHDLLTEVLEREGLAVERHAFGLDTAFVARAGTEGPTIAICCEYDALPGIGHACGHNIIATAGLGAGLAAAALADEMGGRVVVLGTPAEEGGGGKVLLAQRGAFDEVDTAMMVHPAGADMVRMAAISVQQVTVTYTGRASHAAAFPHKGRNALDAAVLGYTNVAALRQHIRSDERIHGIFTEAGDKPNIVPARAVAEWMVRSGTIRSLAPLKARVQACLQAGAEAAGCEMDDRWYEPAYADMVDNPVLVELWTGNARALGREPAELGSGPVVVGSTDMGNVSYVVPSIHPMIKAGPPTVPIHTPEFANHARGPEGDRAIVDGALSMAWTVADLWARPELVTRTRAAFDTAMADAGEEARRSALTGRVPT